MENSIPSFKQFLIDSEVYLESEEPSNVASTGSDTDNIATTKSTMEFDNRKKKEIDNG